jgi:hypothetical protein
MGVIGVLAYSLDIAGTREHPIVVLIGTAFCALASVMMFCLAEDVKNRRD